MDPPYQGVCANRDPRYIEGLSFDDLVETLDDLNVERVSFILSYDGRTGAKVFGTTFAQVAWPDSDRARRWPLVPSHTVGACGNTVESLYLSPALVARIGHVPMPKPKNYHYQQPLFEAAR